jgi:multiple sugar transport system permease protein
MAKKKLDKSYKGEGLAGAMFIAPSLIGFIIFVFVPVFMSLALSFTQWNFLEGYGAIHFNGLDNFKTMFKDVWFTKSFMNNIYFTVVTIPITTGISLVLANLINRHIYASAAVRAMMFIPYIASIVAVCVVWQVLFQPTYGPINYMLKSIGITNPPQWLASFKWALPAIMIINIWQQIGYYVAVYNSGLKAIPGELYEAARIDGASEIRQFFSVTVPMVSPTTFFLVTMGVIGSFKVFDHISVLTQGGPGTASSSVMAFYIYRAAFVDFKMGYASSMAWALFVLVFIVTIFQWNAQKKFVNYD